MVYIEKVINDRIDELKKQKSEIINACQERILEGKFHAATDFYEIGMDIAEFYYKIEELEALKKGLGLVPVQEFGVSEEAVE